MIALAGLPNFAQTLYNPSFRSMLLSRATAFMLTTCTIAYVIKVFYFDVTDDGLQAPHAPPPARARARRTCYESVGCPARGAPTFIRVRDRERPLN